MLGCAICLMGFPLSPQKEGKLPAPGNHFLTQLCPANGCNDGGKLMGQAFLVEFMMTFFFVAFVVQIVKHNGAKDVPLNAVAGSNCSKGLIQTSEGISGGCINPAIGAIQPVFQKVMNARVYPNAPKTSLMYQGAYVGATTLGGIFAGVFQRYFNEYAIRKADTKKKEEIEM
jgi:glycerol uptake facilitator-like aquaporin